jgi:YHS domain-containing protein
MYYTNEVIASDPVCGDDVIEHAQQTVGGVEWKGRTFFFCSFQCREMFEGNPELYLSQAA